MRVRTTVAAGLAMFLAVMSSWASACDLSCSLQRMTGGCAASMSGKAGLNCGHASQTAASSTATSEMPGMPDMPGMTGAHTATAGTEALSPVFDGSQPCSRNSVAASAAAETSRYELQNVSQLLVAVASASEQNLLSNVRDAERRESRPPKSAALNPLSLPLRI